MHQQFPEVAGQQGMVWWSPEAVIQQGMFASQHQVVGCHVITPGPYWELHSGPGGRGGIRSNVRGIKGDRQCTEVIQQGASSPQHQAGTVMQ